MKSTNIKTLWRKIEKLALENLELTARYNQANYLLDEVGARLREKNEKIRLLEELNKSNVEENTWLRSVIEKAATK